MNYLKTIRFILFTYTLSTHSITIDSVIQTCPITVSSIQKPSSTQEIQSIIKKTQGPVSLAGTRGSQGGQIAYPNGTVIDMTNLSQIKKIDPQNKLITVEAGATWRDIQKAIDPYNLSIRVMQTYNDFTVGGSLSVNVHARMVSEGPMIGSIEELEIILADGSLVTANRKKNKDLFYSTIGGYGLLGIVTNVTLRLTDNEPMERIAHHIQWNEVASFFETQIKNNPKTIFFNAVLYPHDFEHATIVTFNKTRKKLTIPTRLNREHLFHPIQMLAEQLLRRIPTLSIPRKVIQQNIFEKPEVVWRNYEMSRYTINSLKPLTRFFSHSILQEYFIPVDSLNSFLKQFKKIASDHNINILNASIRYVPADKESILAYAPVNSYSVVLYINVWNSSSEQEKMKVWTQKLINAALSTQGTFYLPYHLYASKKQFKQAYPHYKKFLQTKEIYDPTCKFRNMLFDAYLLSE